MAGSSNRADGLTLKELVLRVWDDLKSDIKDLRSEVARLEGRVGSLEEIRVRGYWPRRMGNLALAALITALVGGAVSTWVIVRFQ
ncbi:MAG: hypothetical protein ACRDHO_06285 [Actinomycetota bacterium]